MSQVTVIINGHRYRLLCEEGEEERVAQLADHISNHIHAIKQGTGSIGNDRLLVMAALTIADELWDLKNEIRQVRNNAAASACPQTAMELMAAVERVEELRDRILAIEAEQYEDHYQHIRSGSDY